MPTPLSPVASAQATGNAGGNYERHVGAACLATLLTGGMSLLLPDAKLSAVIFQTRRLGWETDDLLLVGITRSNHQRRVALQVKSTFYWRKSDEDCIQTISNAWNDFQNRDLFNPQFDRIGVIVGQTNQKFSKGVRCLVDMARASRDAQDFMGRLGLPKYVASDARDALNILEEILRENRQANISDDSIWQFLCILDFAIFDFDTTSSFAETLVKSLLVGTCNGNSGSGLDTWNSLLNIAGEAAPLSREIRWNDLPDELRNQHSHGSNIEHTGLVNLEANTRIIRDGTDNKIGGSVSLSRAEIVGSVLEALSDNQSVVITGEAGSGKSVVARHVFDAIKGGSFAIAFRSETLAEPHIATSFAGIGGNLNDVLRLFSIHPRKVLWIESAERLLEKDASQRAAFGDLLRLFTQAPGWKLLITCRDYSVETFRTTFLERAGIKSEVISVPDLMDIELEEVQRRIPTLSLPLSQPALRKLARNPFYLDLEARLNWNPSIPIPTNLRTFRDRAWREVICREDEVANGMPIERDRAMIEIAVGRARALTPFVHVDGLSSAALQALRRDSLIIADPNDLGRFSPAHDVYEDWALLAWLNRLHDREGAINRTFLSHIGTHPAIRRAFRRWLTELFEYEPIEGDRRMSEILHDSLIAQHWKDDALVAMLQSSEGGAFLSRSGERYLGSNVALLRRAVHLLRVACCKTPAGIPPTSKFATSLLVPSGRAWDTMPQVIAVALPHLTMADFPWVLRFVEECVGRMDKASSCEVAIGAISKQLLACLEQIHSKHRDSIEERILKVMVGVPKTLETDLRAMLDATLSNNKRGWRGHTLPDLIWSHFSGETICRELPNITMQVAERRLEFTQSASRKSPAKRGGFPRSRKVELIFGFKDEMAWDGSPASAWQGPFANLLVSHSELGLDLILRLLNRACDYYGLEQDIIEEPIRVELILEDQIRVVQWGNERLWGAYRGLSGTPHVLESALMALEEWLLKKAERGDSDTIAIYSRLLRESNNVAITAVLASIAVAYPAFLGEATLPLLTVPILFDWDLQRSSQEQHGRAVEDMFPSSGAEEMLFDYERKESRKKPHRWQHLEYLCLQLQLTSAREKVWALLGNYQSQLPPIEKQDAEDRLWRIKLHRMDIRNFVGIQTAQGTFWQAGNFPKDLEQVRQSIMPAHQDRERRLGLFMWGLSIFRNENLTTYRPNEWREKLKAVRALDPEPEDEWAALRDSGAPHIAAVCLRDHWSELSEDEQNWCVGTVCSEIEKLSGQNHFENLASDVLDRVNSCCFVIPLVVAKNQDVTRRSRLLRCLTIAITNDEVKTAQWAALGLGRFLFPVNRPLSLSLIAVMLARIQELDAFDIRQKSLPWDSRDTEAGSSAVLLERSVSGVEAGALLDEAILISADYRRHRSISLLVPLLELFGEQPLDPLACQFFKRIAELVALTWLSKNRHLSDQGDEEDADCFRYEHKHHAHQHIARFALLSDEDSAMDIIAPLVAAASKCPEDAGNFIKRLVIAEDQSFKVDRFWRIWKKFADEFLHHNLGSDLEKSHGKEEFLRMLFLNVEWNADSHTWKSLTGRGHHLTDFFQKLPPTSEAISAFVPLVNRFSGEFLPASILILAEKIQGTSTNILSRRSVLSQLESAIGDLVYAGAIEIRRNSDLRNKTLLILDAMVESGSAAAFKIRDDFLTPLT